MNHLQHETSPYLLQHANNPVEWYAWKPEAFARAKAEQKPILVSIGYSTCHWCHVMEHESFEDLEVAAFMNKHFINIKVDREERPDVDMIYMEACQLITGHGGWPLNCFLLPDGRPFFAGTYYPPQTMYNRPSWQQVLQNIAGAFLQKPAVVEEQATRLMEHITNSDARLLNQIDGLDSDTTFTPELLEKIYNSIYERFDVVEGGFGSAPKFPGAMTLGFLATYHHYTQSADALSQLSLSLNKMIMGGIYDQIGGGFARYATDRAWLVPHFEKMLYDNALLVSTLADTFRLTKNQLYATTIRETLDFVTREMTESEGGFYSALDADSEGVEGKFYVWQKEEIDNLLGEDAALFCDFYDVTDEGNWEETNILWRVVEAADYCKFHDIDEAVFEKKITKSKATLMAARATRIRPGLDDKILLSWNALMCSAFAKAAQALGNETYKDIAIRNIDFIENKFQNKNKTSGQLFHTYKNGIAQYDAFLDDYAYYILALLDTYEATFDVEYLRKANKYVKVVNNLFYDEKDGLFFYTFVQQSDMVIRKKEMYDNATPSGNSSMALALLRLSVYFDEPQYQKMAARMLLTLKDSTRLHGTSFSCWAQAMSMLVYGAREIVCVGERAIEYATQMQKQFLPNTIYMATIKADDTWPMLRARFMKDNTYIYVCKNQACFAPCQTVEEALNLI